MNEKVDIRGILNRYMKVEVFDTSGSLDKKVQKSAGFIFPGSGSNYLKGVINDYCIETSSLDVRSSETTHHTMELWYTGQLSVIKNRSSFPGKLLIIRSEIQKYGIGQAYYEHLLKTFKFPGSSIWKSPKKIYEQNQINISAEFNAEWNVFSTDSDKAGMMLDEKTELHQRLWNSPRLAFVLYSDDDIFFGGKYSFDPSNGSSDEVREKCEKAIDGLCHEAVPAVLSAHWA